MVWNKDFLDLVLFIVSINDIYQPTISSVMKFVNYLRNFSNIPAETENSDICIISILRMINY